MGNFEGTHPKITSIFLGVWGLTQQFGPSQFGQFLRPFGRKILQDRSMARP